MILALVLKGGQGLHSSYGCIAGEFPGEPMNMDMEHQGTEKSWSVVMNHARRQRRHQADDENKKVIAELRVQLAQANQTILQLRHEPAQIRTAQVNSLPSRFRVACCVAGTLMSVQCHGEFLGLSPTCPC